jgi:hypothetical protein
MRLEDFIYSEVALSPDGAVRVEYGYSGGEKSPTIIEPRIIDMKSDEVLIDLWRSSYNGRVEFGERGKFVLTIDSPYYPATYIADVDAEARTFAFAGSPERRESLAVFEDRFNELRAEYEVRQALWQPIRQPGKSSQIGWIVCYLLVVGLSVWVVMIVSDRDASVRQIALACTGLFGVLAVISIFKLINRKI